MSLWTRFSRSIRGVFASLSHPGSWLVPWLRGEDMGLSTDSGIAVNGRTALQYAPVWYGVNKVGGHIGTTPLSAYEKVADRERQERPNIPGSWVINHPNEFMDSMVFRECIQQHAMVWGNGRAAIERNNRNDPMSLIPLLPDRTITVLVNGKKWHVTTDLETGEKTKFKDDDVLHICGFGFDGIQGYSLFEMARNSIGLGLAAEKHSNRHFRSNAVPGIVLEAPAGTLSKKEDAEEFLRNWNEHHQGVNNSNKAGLLRNGIKATTLGMSGRDAQWIEQRRFQRQEAALFLLLEQILGDDSSVSYNSLEMKNLAYLSSCLNRWFIKWEQQCDRKLLTRERYNSGNWYFKFNRNALLQATAKERFEIYEKGRIIGMFSPNTCLEMEDMPPRKDEGGDRFDNPHTTPGPSPNAKQTDSEPPLKSSPTKPEPDDAQDRLRTLIETRLRGLIIVESDRAVEAARMQKNFVAWLDEFYSDKGQIPKMKAVWQQCGGTLEQMLSHANESKSELMELAGRVGTQTELAALISQATAKWPERAALQAALIANNERKVAA
jgi:HK97 family phage portal protein